MLVKLKELKPPVARIRVQPQSKPEEPATRGGERTVAKLNRVAVAPPDHCLDVGVAAVVPRKVVFVSAATLRAPEESENVP